MLKHKQYELKHKQHRLIQSVATRWNSTYYMMECILEQQQPVSATLKQLRKGDLMPTDTEITTMYDFIQFMKSFVQMTEAHRRLVTRHQSSCDLKERVELIQPSYLLIYLETNCMSISEHPTTLTNLFNTMHYFTNC